MPNNVLTFLKQQHQHAMDFQASLSGETEIDQLETGEWVVRFSQQRNSDKITYFARLPDGRVVQRRSKLPLLGVVATIYSQAFLDGVRGAVWVDAVREYRLAQDIASRPKPASDNACWDAAFKQVSDYAGADEYAAHKVSQRIVKRDWQDFSWRYSMHSASSYAKKVARESRWESAVALNVVGGL